MNKRNIKVSICTITYKHERYIRETIESVLNQEVDFPIEFIIADDHSPDDTEKIVQEYITTHPKGEIIRYTKHKINKGMMGNFLWALNECKGEYIAICEGDDYWIDNLKLKRQYSFLESFSDCKGCGTNGIIMTDKYHLPIRCKVNVNEKYYLKDFIVGNRFKTCSMMIRNDFSLPEYFTKFHSGDINLWMICVNNGGYMVTLPFISTVYRVHDSGVYSGENTENKMVMGTNDRILFIKNNFRIDIYLKNIYTHLRWISISAIRLIFNRPNISFKLLFLRFKNLKNALFLSINERKY